MSEKDGGPAFPELQEFSKYDDDKGQYVSSYEPSGGMSLRDYFAIHAPIALHVATLPDVRPHEYQQRAEAAYRYADAMLKAREAK